MTKHLLAGVAAVGLISGRCLRADPPISQPRRHLPLLRAIPPLRSSGGWRARLHHDDHDHFADHRSHHHDHQGRGCQRQRDHEEGQLPRGG